MRGPGAGHGAAHFPVRLSCWRRARCSRSTPPMRKRRKSSAPANGAPPSSITAPLVTPAILSGTLLAFVNSIALFGSQAIIGLPGRIVTLPTRIYALFDYPPEYGLASALSLVFVLITVAALFLQRSFLARRSFVTLGRQGLAAATRSISGRRAGCCSASRAGVHRRDRRALRALIAVSLSKSWGLEFWKGLTLHNYTFVLFEYDVTQRAILNSLILATLAATLAVLLGAVIGWIDLRTQHPGPAVARLRGADPARAARHRDGGGADPVLAGDADRALRHAGDPAARLCRRATSRSACARPTRRCARSILAGRKRAHPRRILGLHDARGDAAADPARPVRRLAAGIRAGDPGTSAPRSCCSARARSRSRSRSTISMRPAIPSRWRRLRSSMSSIIGAAIWLANRLGGATRARVDDGTGVRSADVMAGVTIRTLTKSYGDAEHGRGQRSRRSRSATTSSSRCWGRAAAARPRRCG